MTVAIGLVGCGRWGRLILRDLVSLGVDVHIAVRELVDADDLMALGATSVVIGTDALCEVDGIVVATPTSVHAESIERVLSRDVPVFVEKPLTDDPAAARTLAERASGRLFVMDKWRYHPGVCALRDLVVSGRLGAIRELRTVRVQDGMPHTDVDCAWILLPHDLSIALEVMGEYPIPVSAVGRSADGILQHCSAEFRFGSGGMMHADFGIDSVRSERCITVVGTEATAVLAGGWEDVVTVTASGDESRTEQVSAVGELPLLAELRAFVEHVTGGPSPVTAATDAARAVAIIEAVRNLAGVGA